MKNIKILGVFFAISILLMMPVVSSMRYQQAKEVINSETDEDSLLLKELARNYDKLIQGLMSLDIPSDCSICSSDSDTSGPLSPICLVTLALCLILIGIGMATLPILIGFIPLGIAMLISVIAEFFLGCTWPQWLRDLSPY